MNVNTYSPTRTLSNIHIPNEKGLTQSKLLPKGVEEVEID